MKLSTRGRYGLKACFALANLQGEVVSLSQLARQTQTSTKYLERLLNLLRQGGIVDTKRGVNGGYFLQRQPCDISLGEIFRALDELEISSCNNDCEDEYCPNRKLFFALSQSITQLLDGISLQEFLEQNRNCK